MRVREWIWDERNRAHLARHGVFEDEAEEAAETAILTEPSRPESAWHGAGPRQADTCWLHMPSADNSAQTLLRPGT